MSLNTHTEQTSSTQAIMDSMAVYATGPVPREHDTMPEDRDFCASARAVITEVFDTFQNTPMETYAEEVAWGMVNTVHRKLGRMNEQLDRHMYTARTVSDEQDGSEVMSTELETINLKVKCLNEDVEVMQDFRDAMCEAYAEGAGKPWLPVSGTRRRSKVLTSAMIDAREARKAKVAADLEANTAEGTRVGFSGGMDFQDYAKVFDVLSRVKNLHPDMVLVHTGQSKGADLFARRWAEANDVTTIAYTPDFGKGGKAAPFKRNDQMLRDGVAGLVVFPGNGIVKNLEEKAKKQGIPVMGKA